MLNKVFLCGRLTRDAEVRYSQSGSAVAKFSLAVDRKFSKEEQSADFLNCTAFGKTAEFLEKYGKKGTKFIVEGRLQTGSYTDKDGKKVYTTDVVVENMEFAESKNANAQEDPKPSNNDGFMTLPDIDAEELPFN
jgi:single-strand DNA-binding protein